MKDLKLLISGAQAGDLEAYGKIVQRFQDLAVGYAYSIIGDFHLAQDAAQEAFIEAYPNLSKVYSPAAFPGWLRKIVFKHCDRLTRRKRFEIVPLEAAVEMPSEAKGPAEVVEEKEMKNIVLKAIAELPENQRVVTTLFYINGYSQNEIADFLEVPVTTVDKRLRTSRKRLKERMIEMVKDTLQKEAPSKDDRFTRTVQLVNACKTGDLKLVKKLIKEDATLVEHDTSHIYQPYLHYAAIEGHKEVVKFLLKAGATAHHIVSYHGQHTLEIASARGHHEIVAMLEEAFKEKQNIVPEGKEICEAAEAKDFDKVKAMVKKNPQIVNAADYSGSTVLHRVVQVGYELEMIDFLLEHGVNIEATDNIGFKPIHYTIWYNPWWFYKKPKWMLTGYLIAKGAEYNINIAAVIGDIERVKRFLAQDSSLANSCDTCKKRPLSSAVQFGHLEIVKLLLQHGADPTAPERNCPRGLSLWAAANNNDLEAAKLLLEHGADVNEGMDSCAPPSEGAYNKGYKEMCELLKKYGSTYDFSVPKITDIKDIATFEAMLKKDLSLADKLLYPFGALIHTKEYYIDDVGALKLAFKYGADPKKISQWNLWVACIFRPHVLRTLFEHGADPNVTNESGETVLHWLASHDDKRVDEVKVAEIFIDGGADLHCRDNNYRATPLAWAAKEGKIEMVKLLLRKGAKPNLPDDEEWTTPLFWAKAKGHKEIVEILKKHGEARRARRSTENTEKRQN